MKHLMGLILLVLAACIPAPEFVDAEVCDKGSYEGVLILNEGVWTQNNSTLSYYDESQEFERCADVFQAVNQSPLGDVGNAALVDGEHLYLVINESGIVYKLALPSLELLAELRLPATASPRQMAIINPQKAYVTSLLDSSLYVFNPVNMELIGAPVFVENYMEGIAIWENKAFIACGNYAYPASNNKLAVLDTDADTVIRYILLPEENPGEVLLVDDAIVVNCRGNYLPGGPGSELVWVDPLQETVSRRLSLGQYTYDLAVLPDALIALGDSGLLHIDRTTFSFNSNFLPKSALTDDPLDLLYSVAYDDLKGELYVTNAKYGGTNGICLVLDPFLNPVRSFETGIYPGEILFYR